MVITIYVRTRSNQIRIMLMYLNVKYINF